jgi:putative sigma-54 modulation protein
MKIIVQGHGIEVTEPLREYAEKKIKKIEEFFGNIQKAELTLDYRKIENKSKSNVTEITVWASGKILRATSGESDMYASIDTAVDKIERQIEKYKDKLKHEKRRYSEKMKEFTREELPERLTPKEPLSLSIVKVKRFALTPLNPEDASQEMELLGHDFYMFLNAKTNEINTIYRRRSGNYGLIEPELK